MSEFSRNLAFIIGINNYTNGISPLQNAVNDAKKLVEILREKHEYQVWVCLDEVATLNNLNKLLEKILPEQVSENDRLLFYFAGHGIALNGDDRPEGYLIPQDAKLGDVQTYLPMTKLQECLNKLPCRHFLGILDCCFAGAFRWSSNRDLLTAPEVIHKERYDRFITDPAWQVITSAASDQKALDAFALNAERRQRGNHSPFAAALIEALAGKADAYPPSTNGKPSGDGVITATELYLYLRDAVEPTTEEHRQRQTPGICPLKKHDKGEYIFLSPGHPLNLPPAPPLDASKNPYRGLKSFDEEHSELFFGRTELVEKLQNFVKTNPLTVVLGASGSGKSSLVKAGLIPELRKETTEQWSILEPIRPGETPLLALNNALKNAQLPEVAPQNPQHNLVRSIDVWAKNHPNSKLLLFIDQSEEIITLCKNEDERKEFFQEILKAINTHRDKLRVVLSLRSDFEPQVRDAGLKFVPTVLKVGNTALKNRWHTGRFIVPAMTRGELREAIEKPAETRVMYFQPHELVEQLIDEVADMPGALPLLSFGLSELYLKYLKRQREAENRGITIDRALTQADYQDLGGVIQSLTQRADEEYEALVKEDPAYAQIIRHVMLRMVALGGGELARRQVPLSELEYLPEKNGLAKQVIERFTKARLLVKGEDAEGNPYLEPAHDALVRSWQRLLAWKQDEEESLIVQRRLTPAAAEWDSIKNKDKEQPKGILDKTDPVLDWLDRRLFTVENLVNKIPAQFAQLLRRSQSQQGQSREKPAQFLWDSNPYLGLLDKELHSDDNWLNQVETEFVRESVVQKRRNISWRWRIAIAVMLGLSGLTLAALAGQRQALIGQIGASRQSAEANWRSNQELDALIDSLRAAKTLKDWPWFLLKPDKELKNQVSQTLRKLYYITKERNRNTKRIGTLVGMTPDNKVLVSEIRDTPVNHLLDSEGNQVISFPRFQASFNPVNHSPSVTYSPDGKLLAVADIYGASWNAGKNGTVSLWNIENKKLIQFPGHHGGVKSISFSPDGKKIATADASDTVRLWNLQDRQEFKEFKNNTYKNIVGIGFSPDNQLLVATRDNDGNKLSLWEIEGKQKWSELYGYGNKENRFSRAIFSNDGKRIVIEYGLLPKYQTDQPRNINIFLWNYLEDKQKNDILLSNLYSFPLETSDISMSISLDGKTLATALYDSNIRFWSLEDKKLEWEEFPHEAISLSLSADGKKLATTDKNGKVGIWNLDSRQFVSIPEIPGLVKNLSLSADGKKLAIINQDGTVGLWNLESRKFVSLNKKFSNGALESKEVKSMKVKFSLDSQQLAIISHKNGTTVNLWNLKTEKPQTIRASEYKIDVIFSPNNQLQKLITDPLDEETTLSDLKDILLLKFQQTRCSFSSPLYTDHFLPVSVSEDGSLIASASSSYDSVCIWDLKNGNELARFKVPQGQIKSISLSGDSSLIAVAVDNGSILLWRIGSFNKLIELGCDSVRDYLKNNPNVDESDRHLCDDVPKQVAKDKNS